MQNSQIHICQLSKIHLPEMMNVHKSCFQDIYQENEFVYDNLITVFPEGSLGAFCDGKLIGYVYFHPYYNHTAKPLNSALSLKGDEDCMYLHEIAVLPAYRALRIPNSLMEEFDKVSVKYQMKYQSLVSVQNSVGFWEKHGFTVVGQTDECEYSDGFLMSKLLL